MKGVSGWIPVAERFIEVVPDQCNGCGRCAQVCSANCYKIKNGKAVIISLEKCYECEACYLVCETGAIKLTYPKGGKGIFFK